MPSKITLLFYQVKKHDEHAEAMGLKKAMEQFELVLMTVIQGKILETVNIASRVLKDKNHARQQTMGIALDTEME